MVPRNSTCSYPRSDVILRFFVHDSPVTQQDRQAQKSWKEMIE